MVSQNFVFFKKIDVSFWIFLSIRNFLLQIAGALAEEGKSLGEISEFMRRNVLRCQFIFRSEHDKLVSRKKSDFFANQFLAPGHPRVGALLLRPAREEGAALPTDGYATIESFVLYVLAEFFFCLFKDGEMEIGLGVHGEAGVRQDSG